MSIGIFNRDSSFFSVDAPSLSLVGNSSPVKDEDIIEFTVEEELGKILSGSLKLLDTNHVYSRIYNVGTKLKITWGYKLASQDPRSFLTDLSSGVLVGRGYRQALIGYVTSPGGSGGNDGAITFSMNWYGQETRGGIEPQIYSSGTKATVISQVLQKMNVPITGQFIDFKRGNEVITSTTCPIQWQTNFRFLMDMSFEWGAVFRIGQDSVGNPIAMFTDFGSPLMDAFTKLCSHAIMGSYIQLGYKAGSASPSTPVKEYTWQNKMGMDGTGDNVQITMINGQPQFFRYNAKTQSVETWILNTNKIKAAMASQPTAIGKTNLMKQWVGAKTFNEVKWAFDKSVETTAPQGAGYTMDIKAIGNPCYTPGVRCSFSSEGTGQGGGFPDFCYPIKGKAMINWFSRKVTHRVDRTGYNMDSEICDAFALNNGLMVH